MQILTDNDYATKRTTKLGLEDFLILLAQFNAKGIHFRWFLFLLFIYHILMGDVDGMLWWRVVGVFGASFDEIEICLNIHYPWGLPSWNEKCIKLDCIIIEIIWSAFRFFLQISKSQSDHSHFLHRIQHLI